MKKVMSLILAAMMVLSAVVALADATPSITVDDLTAPVKVDLVKEAQSAHDAFAPGLPESSDETTDENGDVYTVEANADPEAVVNALTDETQNAIAEVLGTENAVVNEVFDINMAEAQEVVVKIKVASVYEEGTKLAIALIVGDAQHVFEGTVDAEGYVTFTIPAEVAEEIVANNGATVVIANAQ